MLQHSLTPIKSLLCMFLFFVTCLQITTCVSEVETLNEEKIHFNSNFSNYYKQRILIT